MSDARHMSDLPEDPFAPEPDEPGWPPGLAARLQSAEAIYQQLVALGPDDYVPAVMALDADTLQAIVLVRVGVAIDYRQGQQ